MRSRRGLDDLVGAAARVVVRREVPGRRRALVDLVVHLGVIVGHHREQRRLRARGDAVVFVDDLHAHAEPLAPGDLDRLHALGVHEARRQRVAEQVRDRHLRLAVLDALLHLAVRIAGEQADDRRDDRLAAARPTDEQAAPAHGEVEQGQEHVARVALGRGQAHAHALVAEREARRRRVIVFDVVEGADDRAVDDPEVGLAQLLVERRALVALARSVPERPGVELGHVEARGRLLGARIRGRAAQVREAVELGHGPQPISGLVGAGEDVGGGAVSPPGLSRGGLESDVREPAPRRPARARARGALHVRHEARPSRSPRRRVAPRSVLSSTA
jgi:hypothetical protein